MTGRAAAFFDLDRTLIDCNSALLFARYERRAGRIRRRDLLQAGIWTALYHLSLADIEEAYRTALSHYRGTPDALLDARTRAWFDAEVAARLQPGGASALAAHRAAGHPLVLITNSSQYMASAAGERWQMDGFVGNRFPSDADGLLDGTFEQPLCYGVGKVSRAGAWAADHGVDLAASWFYTDSLSDLPLLEAVGMPRVVQPDPRLRRVARQRGWPVLDWRVAISPTDLDGSDVNSAWSGGAATNAAGGPP